MSTRKAHTALKARKGVLLMAYGTPGNLDEVEPYYRDIRGGQTPPPEAVADLTERYRRVGGKTPLLEITRRVADKLEQRLNQGSDDSRWRVYVGMKHWHPYIADTIDAIAADGIDELVELPLAPHYSMLSIAGYEKLVKQALDRLTEPPPTRFIQSWHANPRFINLIAGRIDNVLAKIDADPADVEVVFSAHSLPARIVNSGDPYPDELIESAAAVARAAGVTSWRFAYQSAGKTPTPWLGPDILEAIETIAGEGRRHILSVPFGFVCDHLEILYDIDIEAIDRAAEFGINLSRIDMPNDDPEFVEVLFDLIISGSGARVSELNP
ncbi:MAG: ferrochelatase [Chloroflexi bacterium]|nr:ferrochelatase [Chloroflexota bacterium]